MVQICSTCYEKHSSRAEGVQQSSIAVSSAAEKVSAKTKQRKTNKKLEKNISEKKRFMPSTFIIGADINDGYRGIFSQETKRDKI